MELSQPGSIGACFELLASKHKMQVAAMSKVADFLELVATTELKCA